MKVMRAYRVELEPQNKRRTAFLRHAGATRFSWNWGLARRIEEYKTTGKSSNAFAQHKQLNALKKTDFPWMYEVSKCAPQEALRNLDLAFRAFFRRVKAGQKPGFPRFKSRNRNIGGFCLTGSLEVTESRIKLPRIGWVRLKEHGYIPSGSYSMASVTEQAGHWFVSLCIETDVQPLANNGLPVGVDLGIKTMAVTSDGEVFGASAPLRKHLRLLKHRQRLHSRKQKGSRNRKKSARKLAVLHYRIACVRRDALHKASTTLAKNHSLIAVEDLNVRGMVKNHCLARAILDVGFAEFRRQLEYKCLWYGSRLIVIDRFYPSSKRCSNCGRVKDNLALSERLFRCEVCGMVLDRDLNAARNILVAASSAETLNACGGESSGYARNGVTKLSPMKQEPNTACLARAG